MDLSNLFSGALGAAVVTVFDFLFLRKQNNLESRVDTLEKEKIAKLESTLEKHLDEDSPATVNLQFKTILGTLEKIENKVERMSEINIRNAQELKNHELYLQNLDRSQKGHIRTYHKG